MLLYLLLSLESGYYPGGSGNSYYCSNCRYDFDQANYCCSSNIDRDCCNYVNGGGSGGGGYYPGSGSGSSYDKPGQCPSNSFGRRRKREENPYQYGNAGGPAYRPDGGPAYRPGGNGGIDDGRHGSNNSRCYSDRDCPGSQKCCRDYYGQTRCTYPTYYG